MNNWQEEFKQKWTECNCNKGFDYGQCEIMEEINGGHGMARNDIINFIATLLEKQREEYVEMIKKYKLEQIDKFDGEYSLYLDDIINLIKPHDKTT